MRQLPLYTPGSTQSPVESVAPADLNSSCTKCALHAEARTVCMPADGEAGGLLVLSGHPSDSDDRSGRPMTGATGAYVRGLVDRHWRGPVVYDSTLRCAPGKQKLSPTIYAACRPYLSRVVQDARPQRILALGAEALHGLFGRAWPTFSTRKGYAWLLDFDIPVFFLLNPQAVHRNRFVRGWFEEDIEWALKCALPAKPPVASFARVIETPADAQSAVLELSMARAVTVDAETLGRIHDKEFRALCFGVGDADEELPFVWPRAALDDPDCVAPLRALLADDQVAKGATNTKFDDQVARRELGQVFVNVDTDVQLWRKLEQADAFTSLDDMQPLVGMAGAKDEIDQYLKEAKSDITAMQQECGIVPAPKRKKIADLKRLGHLPVDLRNTIAHRVGDGGVDPEVYAFAGVPEDVLITYCARDVVSESRLRRRLESPVLGAQRGSWGWMWGAVVSDLSRAITAMEQNGVKADISKIAQLQRMCSEKIAAVEAQVAAVLPHDWPGDFNFSSSSPDTGNLLFKHLKLPCTGTTKTGKPATDADTLSKLRHPIADAIIQHRKASKFKAQYADGMLGCIQDDGRIHPSIRIDGTETGRPSCSSPNLFNIPRPKTPEGKLCRDVLVAEPDYELVEADYKQIEIVVAAMLSGDEAMLDIIRSGKDFHLETAKLMAVILGVDPATITKEHVLRDQAKTLNFAVLYGKDEYGLSMELGITRQRAKQLIEAIFGAFPRLKAWIKEMLDKARRAGHAKTWWDGESGYVRPLWEIADSDEESRETAERSSWNTPIQGTATTFTNASLGRIQREIEAPGTTLNNPLGDGRPARLVLTVYDSIIVEAPLGSAKIVGREMKRIMEGWNAGGAPVGADLKHGRSWGSLEHLDLEDA